MIYASKKKLSVDTEKCFQHENKRACQKALGRYWEQEGVESDERGRRRGERFPGAAGSAFKTRDCPLLKILAGYVVLS